jgi:hypothetical protein
MDAARRWRKRATRSSSSTSAIWPCSALTARGNPAGHDPQPAELGRILRQQGHLRGAQGGDALHAAAGHQGRDAGRHLPGQWRQRADRHGHQRLAGQRRRTAPALAGLPVVDRGRASLSGGTPVHYRCDEDNGWMPDLDDIRAKITPAPRASWSSTRTTRPARCIPTSCCKAIVAIARENGLVIFADEVYDKVLYDGARTPPSAA